MKIVGRVAVLLVLAVCIPLAWFAGVGLYYGFDVAAGLGSLLREPEGVTIADDRVPRRLYEVLWVGDIENHLLAEASGLVQSSVDDEVFFSINDSENPAQLFALSNRGEDLGFWSVVVERNMDWEDLAAFVKDGRPYLLIADTGDNFRWRPVLNLYVVDEPVPGKRPLDAAIPVAWQIRFRYPDGYRDCEAVAVDARGEYVYLVSKRTIPAEVYRLPLAPTDEIVTATPIVLLDKIPQPTERDLWEDPDYGTHRSMPTALAMNGNKLVVITYKDAYLYTKGWRQDWAEALAEMPERIALPPVYAREAGAITNNERYLYVTSEREKGTDRVGLYRVDLDRALPGQQ